MSVQFGRWNLNGEPIDMGYLDNVGRLLSPYGPDSLGKYATEDVSIIHCAFHTTQESRREKQPYITKSTIVITWDGRLDNRNDLLRQLAGDVNPESTDLSIVAAAYEQWGSDCFARVIGDWALSIWDPQTRSLILAKDPIGVRHLYYSLEDNQVTWCTVLDPLVLLATRKFALCEEYIAGWLTHFPATHLTPYAGIQSLPPAYFVQINKAKSTLEKYWDFDQGKQIRYHSDADYEDHFRTVFVDAVRRRLRSDRPIIAELSGGMDSSSIVCTADTIFASGDAKAPRLDTVSYYDDSEPNWNERPYFTKIEEKRGRTGCHIDVGKRRALDLEYADETFLAVPGSGEQPTDHSRQLNRYLTLHGHRVLLSGIGGDEVTGGVPTPIPELQDLIAKGDLRTLAHQLKAWALAKRVPWFHLLSQALRRFLPASTFATKGNKGPGLWLDRNFVSRNRAGLQSIHERTKLFGPLPSFQGNISTLMSLQKQLGCELLQPGLLYEKRYPYLDRELLEFVYAIPREQLVRPGRRRSLMRRALRDIVPTEILERKRKAYVLRSPLLSLQAAHDRIETLMSDALIVQHSLVDPQRFAKFMSLVLSGEDITEWSLLLKTIVLELWLRTQDSLTLKKLNEGRDSDAPIYRMENIHAGRAAI